MRFRLAAAFAAALAAGSLICPGSAGAVSTISPDKGKFSLTVQDAEIGTDVYSINEKGQCDAKMSVTLNGNKTDIHTILTFAGNKMTSIFTEAGPAGKMRITISNNVGKTLVDDKPRKDQKFNGNIYPIGNFGPHAFAYVVAAYDRAKGGTQTFEFAATDGIGPNGLAVVKARLSILPAVTRTVAGKKTVVSRFSLVVPGAI